MTCVDIGPSCPSGSSSIKTQGVVRDMEIHRIDVDEKIREIEENLQCLTMGIPKISTNDLPR